MVSGTYSHKLNVAFSDYITRIETGTGKTVDRSLIKGLAENYAFQAAKDVTTTILQNSHKLNPKTSRPVEFSISKRRIDMAWQDMENSHVAFPSVKFSAHLEKLLTTLSTPTEAELVSAEVVGDTKMIDRTTGDYKEILSFLNNF